MRGTSSLPAQAQQPAKPEQWWLEYSAGSGNEFRLYDAKGNYLSDTSEAANRQRARLMQSAPELLAALQGLLAKAEQVAGPFFADEIDAARTAVAQATQPSPSHEG